MIDMDRLPSRRHLLAAGAIAATAAMADEASAQRARASKPAPAAVKATGLDIANTKWSVAAMNNDGQIEAFHPVPWEFGNASMHAGNLWAGGYKPVAGADDKIACEITMAGATGISDAFEVVFVTADRFVATKSGALYRFGKRL